MSGGPESAAAEDSGKRLREKGEERKDWCLTGPSVTAVEKEA